MAEVEEFSGMDQTELAIWNRALSRCGDFRLTFEDALTVTAATAANPVVCTVTSHGFSSGDLVVLTQLDQHTELNGRVFRVESPTTNTFQLADEDGTGRTAETSGGIVRRIGPSLNRQANSCFSSWPRVRDEVLRMHPWNCVMSRSRLARLDAAKTITAATKANPAVITISSHGYVQGDQILIASVGGMIELNDRYYTVGTVPSVNTFQLAGIDSSTWNTYTSGGTARKALSPLKPDFGYAYKYDLPSDCLRLVEIIDDRSDWEVQGRTVLADAGITVPIRYIPRQKDATKYDGVLASALSAALAYQLVEELTQKNGLRDQIARDMDAAMAQARMVDGQEHSQSALDLDDWELERL